MDFSELDAFAQGLDSFDFLGEVTEAAKKIEGTLRSNKARKRDAMSTLRGVMALESSLSATEEGKEEAEEETADSSAKFDSGMTVFAMYYEDGLFYEAKIIRKTPIGHLVEFSGYANRQDTANEHIRPFSNVDELLAAEGVADSAAATDELGTATQGSDVSPEEMQADLAQLQQCVDESEHEVTMKARDLVDVPLEQVEQLMGEINDEHLHNSKGTVRLSDLEKQVNAIAGSEPAAASTMMDVPKRPETTVAAVPLKGTGKEVRATLRMHAAERRAEQARRAEEEQKKQDAIREAAEALEREKQAQLLELDQMFAENEPEEPSMPAQVGWKKIEEPKLASRKPSVPSPSKEEADEAPPPVPEFQTEPPSIEGSLAKAIHEKSRVEAIRADLQQELKAVAQRKLVRAQMRQDVVKEGLNAITDQRKAIRLEARQLTLLAKRAVGCAGRLHSVFVQSIRELTLAAKVTLSMIGILVQQTSFKTLSGKLTAYAGEMQRELVRVINVLKQEHIRLAQAKDIHGADVALLAAFAATVSKALGATNEIVAAHEHSAAILMGQKDEANERDDVQANDLMTRIAKCDRALILLSQRVQALEKQATVKSSAGRRRSAMNPSKRK